MGRVLTEDEIDPFVLGFEPGSRGWYEAQRGGYERPARDPADVRAENLNTFANEAAYMAPIMGEALSGRDAWEASGRGAAALSEGRYKDAVGDYAGMLAATLGAVPVIGTLARGSGRVASWMDRNLSPTFNAMTTLMPADPKNQTNIFAGPGAKTADQEKLAQAWKMEWDGVPAQEIWEKTGWARGTDARWRFEIPDQNAKLNLEGMTYQDIDPAEGYGSRVGVAHLEDVLEHPALFAAYPEMRKTDFFYYPDHPHETKRANFNWQGEHNEISLFPASPDKLSSVMHEGQHNVQRLERTSPGSAAGYERAQPELQHLTGAELDKEAYNRYYRAAGEQEAMNVQDRLRWPDEKRQAVLPRDSERVPRHKQIVRRADSMGYGYEGGEGFMSMAGPKSATADLEALKRAQDMTAGGASRDDVWRDTGWFQGADGKWRYEIDDSGARLNIHSVPTPEGSIALASRYAREQGWPGRDVGDPRMSDEHRSAAMKWARENMDQAQVPTVPLKNAFTHPELYEAYPDIGEVGLGRELSPNYAGTYDHDKNRMTVGGGVISTPTNATSTAVHEGQHAIQRREGFAIGSSVEDAQRELTSQRFAEQAKISRAMTDVMLQSPEASRLWQQRSAARNAQDWDTVDQIEEALGRSEDGRALLDMDWRMRSMYKSATPEEALDHYRRTAGEVESRNVQSRLNYTPDQRRASPPWTTQDTPDDQQIVRNAFADDGPQMSADQVALLGKFRDIQTGGLSLNKLSREQMRAMNRAVDSQNWRTVEIPTSGITATQEFVNNNFRDAGKRYATDEGDTAFPLVVRVNGVSFLRDGHHRAAAAIDQAKPTIKVRYVDIDEILNPMADDNQLPLPLSGNAFADE